MTHGALFLDLDETLVAVATERFFVRELYRAGLLGPGKMAALTVAFLRHALGLISSYEEIKRRLAEIERKA